MSPTKLPNNKSEVKISFYKKLCRKKWFKIARPILITLLIILVIYILTIIGVFKIKNIEVVKNLVYVGNLEQITDNYKGQGYFSLDLNKLEEDIVTYSPYIKSVSTEKIFPNKVRIKAEEYIPISYLEYKDICYIFSEEGIILEKNEEYETCELESGIELESQQNIIAEKRLIFDSELYEVSKILEEFDIYITNVVFDKNRLELSDGEKSITLEINQEYENQLSKLYLVLEKVNIESIQFKSVDLRFNRPVMKIE
jgi:cell division protein FtsQ